MQVLLPTKRQVDEHRASVQAKERRVAEIVRAKKARRVRAAFVMLLCFSLEHLIRKSNVKRIV